MKNGMAEPSAETQKVLYGQLNPPTREETLNLDFFEVSRSPLLQLFAANGVNWITIDGIPTDLPREQISVLFLAGLVERSTDGHGWRITDLGMRAVHIERHVMDKIRRTPTKDIPFADVEFKAVWRSLIENGDDRIDLYPVAFTVPPAGCLQVGLMAIFEHGTRKTAFVKGSVEPLINFIAGGLIRVLGERYKQYRHSIARISAAAEVPKKKSRRPNA